MKELFLDSANLDHIRDLIRTDAIQGVTTNPSLMAKEEKGDYVLRLREIAQAFQTFSPGRKHLSVEVTTTDPDEMCAQAVELNRQLSREYNMVQLHVKIPLMMETLRIITRLKTQGIKVNATACITTLQAKLAHDAGADVVSFFYRRGKDGNEEMDLEIGRFARFLNRNSRIIAGSIREPMDVYKCWDAGADIVTAPYKIIEQMTTHPQTTKAIAAFQKDIDSWLR